MSLTLDCVCPGADIGVCEISALTFIVDVTQSFVGTPTISASHTLTLFADKSDPSAASITIFDPTAGEYVFDLPLADWESKWGTYEVDLSTASSGFQVPIPAFSAYDQIWCTYYIKQDFVCTNPSTMTATHPTQKAYTKDPQDNTRCEPLTGDVRTICYAGQGVGSLFYKSTSLSTCGGCDISDKDFEPAVDAAAKVDISSGSWCICASGGSGRYVYGIGQGQLPGGMSLDANSGCITGIPNGKSAGTKLFTFTALDLSTQETAQVVCGILGMSCSGSISGNQAY